MERVLRIAGWKEHFENHRTRELKSMSWVPFPNKHDGDGYTELLDHPEGGAHFGAWCAMVQVASKCEPRGTLVRDGDRPHTAMTISRMTKFPAPVLKDAIARLLEIGWLEFVEIGAISRGDAGCRDQPKVVDGGTSREAAPSCVRAGAPGERNGTERKGREQKYKNRPAGVFACVTSEILRDTGALLAWIDNAESQKVLCGSQQDRISTVAAAERALSEGDNPSALFVSIVKARDWKLLTCEQEDRARKRLKEFERERGPPSIGKILHASGIT